jgi:hypothetical protein
MKRLVYSFSSVSATQPPPPKSVVMTDIIIIIIIISLIYLITKLHVQEVKIKVQQYFDSESDE